MPQETSVGGEQIVSTELTNLGTATIGQLRAKWTTVFRIDPPLAFGPDLLRRALAQHFQKRNFGGLTRHARRELDRAVNTIDIKPTGRIELPRRMKPGAVLVRQWKGSIHRVIVLDQGYAYACQTYSSLSQIARDITGTRWNGPRFFGLRASQLEQTQGQRRDIGNSPEESLRRRRGRPRKRVTRSDRQQPL